MEKIFFVKNNDLTEVNEFLEKYGGESYAKIKSINTVSASSAYSKTNYIDSLDVSNCEEIHIDGLVYNACNFEKDDLSDKEHLCGGDVFAYIVVEYGEKCM